MNVVFEDEKSRSESSLRVRGGLYGFLLAKGIVKNRQQANLLMVIFLVVCLFVIYALVDFTFQPNPNARPIDPEDSYRAGNPEEIEVPRR